MHLGRVIGTVVADRKYEGLEGKKLLVVQPLDHRREPTGEAIVSVDTAQAGPGDFVYLTVSREAALALDPWFVPVDSAIVGIVDQLDADDAVGRRRAMQQVLAQPATTQVDATVAPLPAIAPVDSKFGEGDGATLVDSRRPDLGGGGGGESEG
ncbi:MAG: EutN/CcmL family microcompartment protein [Myxococcales bacterium]|nr:EutN/CcmL family microcompartment protein [Myxococcales bacterium]